MQFIQYFGTESNGYTTSDAVDKLTINQLKDLVEIIHPNDISNTDALEYGHIDAEDIRYVAWHFKL